MREILHCSREVDNPNDDHVVTVIRTVVIVDHVPRYVSQGFSLFILLGGNISAGVVSTFDLHNTRRESSCASHASSHTQRQKYWVMDSKNMMN